MAKFKVDMFPIYPIIYRVSYITGGAGFLPSTILNTRWAPSRSGNKWSDMGLLYISRVKSPQLAIYLQAIYRVFVHPTIYNDRPGAHLVSNPQKCLKVSH